MRRRDILKGGGELALLPIGPYAWAAAADGAPKRLIVILLRGAVDGLNVVVPYAERGLLRGAPIDRDRPPGKPDGALPLDGHFGLHPALCQPDAAMGRAQPRLYPCRGLARSDPIAFRRPALSRERHAGAGHDP